MKPSFHSRVRSILIALPLALGLTSASAFAQEIRDFSKPGSRFEWKYQAATLVNHPDAQDVILKVGAATGFSKLNNLSVEKAKSIRVTAQVLPENTASSFWLIVKDKDVPGVLEMKFEIPVASLAENTLSPLVLPLNACFAYTSLDYTSATAVWNGLDEINIYLPKADNADEVLAIRFVSITAVDVSGKVPGAK